MVFAMAMPAMATDNTYNAVETNTITISSTKGHTYEAYQIFKGKVATQDEKAYVLSDFDWGDGIDRTRTIGESPEKSFSDVINEVLQLSYEAIELPEGETKATWDPTDAKLVAAALQQGGETVAKEFAQAIEPFLSDQYTESVPMPGDDTKYTIDVSAKGAGYYLIKDADDSLKDDPGEAYTAFMLQVIGHSDVTAKSGAPSSEKKVKDVNDSKDEGEKDWQDSADYDVGDQVPFQLSATIGDQYDEYEHYYFAFHDKQSAGLGDPENLKVYVDTNKDGEFSGDDGDIEITPYEAVSNPGGYELKKPGSEEGCTFEIIIYDLKLIKAVATGTIIRAEYTSKLLDSATVGNPGNSNEMHLEYSNNPNSEYNGTPGDEPDTGETPDDIVIVFTYMVDVDKIDDGGASLKGAAFKLEKWIPETDAETDTKGSWEPVKEFELKDGDATKFDFTGVDDGIYRLTETETPAGYNTMTPNPVYFEITAEHKEAEIGEGNKKIVVTKLSAASGEFNEETGEFTAYKVEEGEPTKGLAFSVSNDSLTNGNGTLETDVVNKKGTTLPETGGIGTTIFYVVGSVLVLAAVILLVTKRRMKSE